MAERINRSNDRRVYQHRLPADLIHGLWVLKSQLAVPMTVLIHREVAEYLVKTQDEISRPESEV